ncbi:hypothetical protein OPQ81_000556 [Rhizoctonia solani]|nr:hypothetical protein OPQ81_000556 [Rhizoctonia solani]
MYFFAADGHYTKIQVATSTLIPVGERYQFFVKLDQAPGDYCTRISTVVLSQLITGYSILHYSDQTGPGLVEMKTLPTSKHPWTDYAGNVINGGTDLVQANLAPFPDNPPPLGEADVTLAMNATRTSEFGWVLNSNITCSHPYISSDAKRIGNTWHAPPDGFTPLLFQAGEIASLDPKVYFSYTNGTLVDIVFTITAENPAMHPAHPMHKHGIKAWFLGSGDGKFPYASIQEAVDAGYKGINIKNPLLMDDLSL